MKTRKTTMSKIGLSIIQCDKCGKWFEYDSSADMLVCPNCGEHYYSEEWLNNHPETEVGKRWKEHKGHVG